MSKIDWHKSRLPTSLPRRILTKEEETAELKRTVERKESQAKSLQRRTTGYYQLASSKAHANRKHVTLQKLVFMNGTDGRGWTDDNQKNAHKNR